MVPLLVGGVGVGLPAGVQRGAAARMGQGTRVFLLQLHRVLFDGAPPADAPAQPQAPDAAPAAAAAPRTGAAEPPSLPAATPGNTRRHIRRKRKRRKRRVRRRRKEEAARICCKVRFCFFLKVGASELLRQV